MTPIPNIDNSTDPHSGNPYKVKETKTHVILYSVGRNLEEDGGSIEKTDGRMPEDVGVRIR